MLLDMAGRRPILMLCTILLVLIKCTDTKNGTDTQNDNQSSPHASTTATLTPTPVNHSNSAGLENAENSTYSNASTSHPASTVPSKPAPRPSTTPASSTTGTDTQKAASPPASHPLTTSLPLNPTSVTHTTASSPPTSHPLTTSIPLNPTTVTHATAPSQSPPGCEYNIMKKIPCGFEILTGVNGSYRIEYQDGQDSFTNVTFNGSSHQIMELCYNYTAIKVFNGTSSCSLAGNKIFPDNDSDLLKIEFDSSTRQVCRNAIWNTSDVTFKVNNMDVKGSCQEINKTSVCSSVLATIISAKCPFKKTEKIDIIPALKDIKLEQITTWPVHINETWPLQCQNKIDVNYTCENGTGTGQFSLKDLILFRKYSCSGELLYERKPIQPPKKINLTIDTDCDVKISLTKETITNTSAHFKWEVHSRKCPNLLNEQEYKNKCEYVCEYKATNGNEHGSVKNNVSSECELKVLNPYTKYDFVLKLQCYRNDVKGSKLERTHMTAHGIPEGKIIVRTKSISSNGFKITCAFHGKRNGKIEQYSAKMIDQHNSIQEEKENKNICEFEFTGLSYSTTYYLTVQVHNGRFSSSPSVPITFSAGYVKESGTHMTKMEVEQFCLANNPSTR